MIPRMRKTPIKDLRGDFGAVEIMASLQLEPSHPHRQLFDQDLDPPLSDHEWQWIQNSEPYRKFQKREVQSPAVVAHVEQTRAAFGKEVRLRGELPPCESEEALSAVLASIAEKTEPVLNFRSEYLGGKLLAPEKVADWVEARSREDGKGDRRVSIEVLNPSLWDEMKDAEIRSFMWSLPRAALQLPEVVSVLPAPVTLLQYHSYQETPTSTGRLIVRWPTPQKPRPVLFRLYLAADWLSRTFGWRDINAVDFILTGAVPPPAPQSRYRASLNSQYPVLNRLTLEINPEMSPKELAVWYRDIRQKYFRSRVRSMTAKHIQLAQFYATCDRTAKWKELMAKWNKSARIDWRYRGESNFERDCKQALRRILGTSGAK